MPIMMKVDGAKIRLIRESRNLTQDDLAQLAGVSKQAVSYWEQDGVKSFRVLNRIAELLQVRPDIFLATGD
jgi:transcriptional regulator with XRE-family HTH domain